MRSTALLALACALPGVAQAGRRDKPKKPDQDQGMLMPDLSKVLGDAWQVPPELSDRAQPGAVLDLSGGGLQVVMPDCVATAPNENSVTDISMTNRLSGGVGWGAGGVGASASAGHTLKLSFQSPMVKAFYLVDFVPSDACVSKLQAYAARGGAVSSLVVVQEALMARVSGCDQTTVAAGLSVPGGAVGGSGAGACQMFSAAPVTVGLKTKAVAEIPELAGLGGGGAASASAPAPRSAPAPAPAPAPRSAPAPAPAPAPTSSRGKAGIAWVELGRFQISKTEVTVGQYRKCVDAGACTAPGEEGDCNWGQAGREDHPVNCVDWHQATAFAKWAGGRLPSGEEWTFAATSGGQSWKYPWGNQRATCSRAVMVKAGKPPNWGCGESRTWPVCSKPAGNSTQGVCDLAGNVWEWTQEKDGASYVVRGGGWHVSQAARLQASSQSGTDSPSATSPWTGFRVAR